MSSMHALAYGVPGVRLVGPDTGAGEDGSVINRLGSMLRHVAISRGPWSFGWLLLSSTVHSLLLNRGQQFNCMRAAAPELQVLHSWCCTLVSLLACAFVLGPCSSQSLLCFLRCTGTLRGLVVYRLWFLGCPGMMVGD